MKEIKINEQTYVLKEEQQGNLTICILQRGWVMIGNLIREGSECTLENASVIRKWGTTKGLGQIATEGFQEDTILDYCGTVHFDYLTVVAAIKCDESKFK